MQRLVRPGSFNSRTPGGVRLRNGIASGKDALFQFTHPGRGATTPREVSNESRTGFQFTHPGRGATASRRAGAPRGDVSIHAPREGCDRCLHYSIRSRRSFNSRTPGGVRRRPCRRGWRSSLCVSIHAPREGCDVSLAEHLRVIRSFNSRTPGGVRRRR